MGLLVAISSSPSFSWTEDYISLLGVEGSTATLFNAGLILAGVFCLIFAIGLRKSFLSSRLGRSGIASLILGSMALSAMGIFPQNIDLPHDLASILFFVFVVLALVFTGVAALAASQTVQGLLSLAAAVLIITFRVIPWPWSGGAIPQLLFFLPWSLWVTAFAVGLLLRPGPSLSKGGLMNNIE